MTGEVDEGALRVVPCESQEAQLVISESRHCVRFERDRHNGEFRADALSGRILGPFVPARTTAELESDYTIAQMRAFPESSEKCHTSASA